MWESSPKIAEFAFRLYLAKNSGSTLHEMSSNGLQAPKMRPSLKKNSQNTIK